MQAEETASQPQRIFLYTKLSQHPDKWTSQTFSRRVARWWSGLLHCYISVSMSRKPVILFYRRVRKITKNDYWLRHVCPSVHPSACQHGTTRLSPDGFSWNSIFETLRKNVERIQVSLKSYKNLAEFFLEWEMFPNTCKEKKTQFYLRYFFFEIVAFMKQCGKIL